MHYLFQNQWGGQESVVIDHALSVTLLVRFAYRIYFAFRPNNMCIGHVICPWFGR
jgi:hypothetical protein